MNKKKKIVVALAFLIVCSILGIQLAKIPQVKSLVQIKVVKVKGTDRLTKDDIKQIFSNQNWFFLNESEIEKKLKEKFPFIKKVKIQRLFVNEVRLLVLEREPFAILKTLKNNYIIDDEGYILKYYQTNIKDLPLVIYKNKSIDKKKVSALLDIYKTIDRLYMAPKKFIIKNRKISCITKDDKIFIFDLENYKRELKKFEVFAKKVNINFYRYIDLSSDSMVITRR